MDSPQARSKGDFVWGETLWHELVHVTHLRLTENRIPRWLAEGIAVYETSTANPHWHMNLDIPFIRAFRNDRILPLKDLDSGFNRPTNPGQVTLSYFQASLVVEYLVEKYGHPKLQETFPKFKSDMETEPVFKEVYGKDLDALNEEFVDYVNDKYNFEQVDYDFNPRDLAAHSKDMETYLLEKVVEKPNNPFLNNHLGMYYKKNGELDQALQHLTKAKELFPNYVSGESPYKSIAEIYLKQGKKQAAIAELNELTSLNGKDLESLNLLADLCVETQDYDCAIEAFQKIIFITPFEPEIHKEMASVYMKKKQYQMAIEEFRTLLLTEPQDMAGAHCDLAEAYLKADKKADAKKSALAALEIAPNYERAQEILLACVE
ncbi:tetratricopeptide repeat protein [candidate division KSB1 bacterium]|nr:tetratricopeptide repeat protein [candidate division KSB1 bacterium]NIR70443.1 tetratricopeptide repeat protein [candidate division KSB1 bacterium]NIS23173.1 tetratricopeptide repeat protein [candidate division KSB1 bacterium]NIT70032.1 tetratricopeptide repeat protein [candidate division KSB1 bacterium]NIU23670.1 tetratricopeptide repeat protein [candidate division KSB1 bacterium]